MTLHKAIEQLLLKNGRSMTSREIADALNRNKWYQKKDGSLIESLQVYGRTKKYAQLFAISGSTISLNGNFLKQGASLQKISPQNLPNPLIKPANSKLSDFSQVDKVLMNEKNFKSAATIDSIISHNSGIYCIRIKGKNKLPVPFNMLFADRNHNIIYIGIATTNLYSRFLKQELRANGHGTFFRSIGAVLGYRPPKGSLRNYANKRKYKFSPPDQMKIIDWINENLLVNWIDVDSDFETFETTLLNKYRPLLNLTKNPSALLQLKMLRAECVELASSA